MSRSGQVDLKGQPCMTNRASAAGAAWLLAVAYYFYQYALRSAPAVMIPQIADAFDLTAIATASIIGLFYYGYSGFSLVAGTVIDHFGARAVLPAGALLTGLGSLLFATSGLQAAQIGRVLQGAGGAFALVGAIYIASNSFPASRAATLTGAAQMFGMAGGSAGQILVGPAIAGGLPWASFWVAMGVTGVLIGVALFIVIPEQKPESRDDRSRKGSAVALLTVFKNPQTLLSGIIAGLLFIPTTIFDMIWGVRFLQEAHGFDFGEAVMRSATVPLGWIIGCPLLGLLSDRIGRRKPVIMGGAVVLLGCLVWILYGPADVLPPYLLGLVAGVASGGAMLTYTVSKEANAPHLSGTATGAVSFLNLTFSALVGPFFGWLMRNVGSAQPTSLQSYQTTFQPLLYGVALAIVLTLVLKETGRAVRVPLTAAAEAA
jgi:MFS family permease